MIMPQSKTFSVASNVNLYIISTIEQGLKRKLIYFHILRYITMPYGLNRRLIGSLRLHMSAYSAFMPRKSLDNEEPI